uniref:Putative secreted protein n=1 Tax=Ixodes ricinus TaxID=34613 RepID=A0A6B0UD95_IXORI
MSWSARWSCACATAGEGSCCAGGGDPGRWPAGSGNLAVWGLASARVPVSEEIKQGALCSARVPQSLLGDYPCTPADLTV